MKESPPPRASGAAPPAPGRSLLAARKTSRMKDEKDVKEPQKPVARPMYRGIVFLIARWAFFAAATSATAPPPLLKTSGRRPAPWTWSWYIAAPRSCLNSFRSSARKPMIKLPPTLAQRTPKDTGAPG
ncbi:hypothetical protein CH063_14884 [Colletotrichum higginsianum]|nr:hypothetical protein CH063_14884 [Colletotrichum higginsianum]